MSSPPVHDSDFNNVELYMYLVFLFGSAFNFLRLLQDSGQRTSPRFYTSSESLQKPVDSAARKLVYTRSKNAYISHIGLDPRCFHNLHEKFKKEYPPLLLTGRPRALDTRTILALVLMWLHSTMKQERLCVLFGVTAASVSRSKIKGIKTLYRIFTKNKSGRRWNIRWPSDSKKRQFNEMIHANNSNDFKKENKMLTTMDKSDSSASQVIVFTLDGCITKRVVHNIWLGIASTVDDHSPLLSNEDLRQIASVYGRLILPLNCENNLKRKICMGTGFSNMKSAEWLVFLMVSFLVLLRTVTRPRYRNFLKLVKIARIVCSTWHPIPLAASSSARPIVARSRSRNTPSSCTSNGCASA
ncbi:hypothetical protein V8B55DRAFT_1570936 [Mucor lusitanicus]|uniref:Uncharacterized protein n=1 Tax=Mucor lusitanicus CBS 277.49 TaxID=747725 RepID=A0A168J947_MUCCL|nr:hypothetical protein MUCCIDRAFT_112324 [Mucor lusitanicus CBS 277.49]